MDLIPSWKCFGPIVEILHFILSASLGSKESPSWDEHIDQIKLMSHNQLLYFNVMY